MPRIFSRYTAELAISHARRSDIDEDGFTTDITDQVAIVEFPLDVHILLRDNWTGRCIAQRVARGYDNRILLQIMGPQFAVYYQDVATHHIFTGVINAYTPINRRQQQRLRRELPRPM